jgi:hypothetical protein
MLESALWCDRGGEDGNGHPFSPRDKSRKTITVESYDGSDELTLSLCKAHAQESGFVPKDDYLALAGETVIHEGEVTQ